MYAAHVEGAIQTAMVLDKDGGPLLNSVISAISHKEFPMPKKQKAAFGLFCLTAIWKTADTCSHEMFKDTKSADIKTFFRDTPVLDIGSL